MHGGRGVKHFAKTEFLIPYDDMMINLKFNTNSVLQILQLCMSG